jgi:hypothetical protein
MGSGSGEADQRHHVVLTVAPPPGEADPVPDAAGRPPRLAPVGAMSGFAAGTQGRRPGFGASTADRTRIASRFIFRSGLRMVDPAAKREGVAHLQAELGLPEWGPAEDRFPSAALWDQPLIQRPSVDERIT